MRETGAGEPGASMGGWLAPVEMPAQTYQWNKRAVTEPEAAPAEETSAEGTGAQGTLAVAVAAPAVELPPLPPPAVTWAPPAAPVTFQPVTRRSSVPTRGGLTAACVLAVGLPLGLTLAVEHLTWRHPAGANGALIALVGACLLIGSMLLGLLASELGSFRSVLRGVVAAALSCVTLGLTGLLVDAHPAKFGFHLHAAAAIAALGPVVAFATAALGRRD